MVTTCRSMDSMERQVVTIALVVYEGRGACGMGMSPGISARQSVLETIISNLQYREKRPAFACHYKLE